MTDAPAIIPDLDWIEFQWRGFGVVIPMSEKRQQRARAKLAAEMVERGEPFVCASLGYGEP